MHRFFASVASNIALVAGSAACDAPCVLTAAGERATWARSLRPDNCAECQRTFEEKHMHNEGVDARRSAFYDWLDNATTRALVDRSRELSAGERLILIKGLVPGLVEEIGLEQFCAFLAEIETKAHRFQEAVDHPGEGRANRTTAGEELGGPTPAGHQHLATTREPDRRGAREAERAIETELWAATEHAPRTDPDG